MRSAGFTGAAVAVAVLLAGCGGDDAPVPANTAARSLSATTARTATTPRLEPATERAGFYSPDSPWNTPLPADAPLDPKSDTYVSELREQVDHGGATIAIKEFSIPIYRVGPDQPRVRVELTKPAPELQRAFEDVPLPDDARAADGTDGAIVVYQPATDTMWEFWRFRRDATGYVADWGGRMVQVSKNPGYYRERSEPEIERPFWGFNATHIGGAAGVITLDDLRRGRIDHVLYLAIPEARKGVCAEPANATDGATDSPDAIPEGARFRLDPGLDVEALNLPEMTAMMARAAQRYGVVVINRAGSVSFAAEDPAQYGGDPYAEFRDGRSPAEIASAFPWEHLETPRLRLRRC